MQRKKNRKFSEKKEEVQEVSMSLSEVAESEKIQQEEEVKEELIDDTSNHFWFEAY